MDWNEPPAPAGAADSEQKLLTNSRVSCYRDCTMRHHFRYVQGYEPWRTAHALIFGDRIHKCLEAYWRARKARADDPIAAMMAALPGVEDTEVDAYDRTRMEIMLHCYAAVWGPERYKVLAVEEGFDLPLRTPEGPSKYWRRAGKIDLMLETPERQVLLVEHKCVAGDARIFDHTTGTYERADDLFRRGVAPIVTALNGISQLVTAPALPLRLASVRPIYRIATLGGRVLRVSGNHPILAQSLTRHGWIEADALVPGDEVATHGDLVHSQPGIDPHVRWDRVVSVERQPEEQTYDVEVPNAHTFVVEGIITHNTSSEDPAEGSLYRKRLVLDEQISYYMLAAEKLGLKAHAIVYDVLAKPKTKPLEATPLKTRFLKDGITLRKSARAEAESLEAWRERMLEELDVNAVIHRIKLHRFQNEMVRFEDEVWKVSEQMRQTIEGDLQTRNSRACNRYFGSGCPYLDVCQGTASIEDPKRFRRLTVLHPELEQHR